MCRAICHIIARYGQHANVSGMHGRQPDRSQPQSSWLFAGSDSTLRSLSLQQDGSGNAKLSEKTLLSFAPPLENGEIVSAVAVSTHLLVCRP
eukprot:1527354-Rhodomonas_salina.1